MPVHLLFSLIFFLLLFCCGSVVFSSSFFGLCACVWGCGWGGEGGGGARLLYFYGSNWLRSFSWCPILKQNDRSYFRNWFIGKAKGLFHAHIGVLIIFRFFVNFLSRKQGSGYWSPHKSWSPHKVITLICELVSW